MAELLDGKKVSQELLTSLTREIQELPRTGTPPKLSVVLVGDNPASHVYVNRKAKVAREIGLLSDVITFDGNVSAETLKGEIQRLNQDPAVSAILVQLPLPAHLDTLEILTLVSPEKDVDGFHPLNLGRLMMGQPVDALPCTPAGIMAMLNAYRIPLEGKHAVVVGRSNIVGKPMGMLLLQRNATVSYCHSRTRNLSEMTRQADILIAAVGVPELIKGEDIAEGAVVVDVGMNRLKDGRLVGDVAYESAKEKASYITPVPGGVGPMTIATLMANTLALYRRQTAALGV